MLDVRVIYTNLSRRPIALEAANFTTRRGRDRGEISQVVDVTGMDLSDDRSDNDNATQVIDFDETPKQGTIRLKPGESREIEAGTWLPDGVSPLDDGQKVTVFIPTATGAGQAVFVTDSIWF